MTASGLTPFVGHRPTVLVFIPNQNELQRFVLSGAFTALDRDRRLHYVLPDREAGAMRAVAPVLHEGNSSTLVVPSERFGRWSTVFKAGSEHPTVRSLSYGPGDGLEATPGWHAAMTGTSEVSRDDEQAFDAQVRELLADMTPLPALLALFEQYQPLFCMVPTCWADPFCNEVAWACERQDVACVRLQSAWGDMYTARLVFSRESFAACWGPQSVDHALNIQRLLPKRVTHIGAPHFQFLYPAGADEVGACRVALGVGEEERLLLFCGSLCQLDEVDVLQELDRAITDGRIGPCRIVYRPHPWGATHDDERQFLRHSWVHVILDPATRERNEYGCVEARRIECCTPGLDPAYIARLVSASDAVVSTLSVLLIEALLLRKPTLAIAFGDPQRSVDPFSTAAATHYSALRKKSEIVWCDHRSRLVNDIASLIEPRPEDSRQMPAERLIDHVVTREPGTYSDRLASFCTRRVERMARKQRARRSGVKQHTVSHAYGAHLIAQDYCGIDRSRKVIVPGYWMHGWIPSYHNIHAAFVALHNKKITDDIETLVQEEMAHSIQWVSRVDQAAFLIAEGYTHVRAIGLPIAYLPDPGVRRISGSLLVLPPHGHRTHGPGDPLAEAYADSIAAISSRFSEVWVGISEDDWTRRQWIEAFRARGVGVFMTSDQGDPGTLRRLRGLFSTFEYVTTNGFGSHIAFAAYCGASVSVFGPFASFPRERLASTRAVKLQPSLLDRALELCAEPALRHAYPFLFVEPEKAIVCREWGAAELGEATRLSPEELRCAFGWEGA